MGIFHKNEPPIGRKFRDIPDWSYFRDALYADSGGRLMLKIPWPEEGGVKAKALHFRSKELCSYEYIDPDTVVYQVSVTHRWTLVMQRKLKWK